MADSRSEENEPMADSYTLGSHGFSSRLIVGSGKYPSFDTQLEATRESGADMITVALRRVDLQAPRSESLLGFLPDGITVLPNTAACFTVEDAVTTAQLGRELFGHGLVKLEVIGDERTLFPDVAATLEAARILVDDGFEVLPYVSDDPVACQRLAAMGCAAVMPLAAPIGSGLGIRNPANLRIILETVEVPVIVDAGVGTASDAAVAMELGCTAILMNSAIAGAKEPVQMARAMRLAVEAGRLAYESGRIPRRLYASASSPLDGLASF
jgi:thiazole synthase